MGWCGIGTIAGCDGWVLGAKRAMAGCHHGGALLLGVMVGCLAGCRNVVLENKTPKNRKQFP